MPTDYLVTRIRHIPIRVDASYEEEIGVYGIDFWNGIANGTYESQTFDFIESRASQGSKVFIDVGSATGCMVLYASALGMDVIGTEPQNLVFEALERNIRLNSELPGNIEILHTLIGTKISRVEPDTNLFTSGASGPLSRAIEGSVVSLESLVNRYTKEDKVSIKIDIEGAEFPLLSDLQTLEALRDKSVTVYLSFHPGFRRGLDANPTRFELTKWRILSFLETVNLVRKLQRYSRISLPSEKKILNTISVMRFLINDQKDFILNF